MTALGAKEAAPLCRSRFSPGAVAHVHLPDGSTASACAGLADLAHAVPITTRTAFNIGSVAKQITAHLAVLAAQDGLLDLAAPVCDLLPRLRVPGVTSTDLIRHTSGIRDTESLLSLTGLRDLDHYTGNDLIELAYRQKHRAIGKGQFLYSNTSYLLLSQVLEQVHNSPLQDIAEKQVFTPLGMNTAHFKSDPGEVIPHAATSYSREEPGWRDETRPVTLPGPGSLWCSAPDLDRWLRHLYEQWTTQEPGSLPFDTATPYTAADQPHCVYGPGLYARLPTSGAPAVFHHGHEHGFSAAAHLTRDGLRIVCLSNHVGLRADHLAAHITTALDRSPKRDTARLLQHAINEAPRRTEPHFMPRTPSSGAAHHQHTWLGTFTCDEVPGTLRLSRHESTLHLWRSGTPDKLIPTDQNTHTGPGYTIHCQETPDHSRDQIKSFTLNLLRAPGLHYRRAATPPPTS